jgi:DNA-directed RNA polymerase specialized sigma24 family protein
MTPVRLRGPTARPAAAGGGSDDHTHDGAPLVVSFAARQVETWLRRLIDGDADAATWLYDTFAPALYRRLRRRYCYPGGLDPDDLQHDAFVYFFQARCAPMARILERVPEGELTPEILERALWDLACGVACNRRRSAARRRRATAPLDAGMLADPPREERLAVSRDLLRQVDACLRRARPQVYLYFKLRYWDGLSPSEIVSATGWSSRVTYKLKETLTAALTECAASLGIRLP